MRLKAATPFVGFTILILALPAVLAEEKGDNSEAPAGLEVVWTEPVDIASRNLFYGLGGEQGQPRGTVTFLEEDREGTNPKIEVRDRDVCPA